MVHATGTVTGDGGADFHPPTNRMVIAVLSLVGLFVALYLLAYGMGLIGSMLCGVGDCAAVQASPYARVGGIPVSTFGVLGYIALLVLSLLGVQPKWAGSRGIGMLLVAGASLGFAYSLYLTYLEAFVIHAWCQWCVISAILMTLIWIASLAELRRPRNAA